MNNSNIVAIPSHPPLPRGVPGVFHSDEQPYYYARDSKAPVRLQQQLPTQGYTEMPRSTAHAHPNAVNRMRRNSGYHPYQVNAYRRDSAASFGSKDASYRPIMSSPSQRRSIDLPLSTYGRSRNMSVTSDMSSTSAGDKAGSNSDRKYVCDWKSCGQSFDRIEHLNRHKRRHTGEKPYCCVVSRCSKLFSRFDNMVQHVGIHMFEGQKTEIPNIKNLNAKCNGRGRARRTSYRGSQDPYEKFRRHVDDILGTRLAKCCILPADTPDFSNLTLRPLLVEYESTLSEAAENQPLSEQVSPDSQPNKLQRPRSDSVIDTMDKHLPAISPAKTAPTNVSKPSKDTQVDSKMQSYLTKFRVQPPSSEGMHAPRLMNQNLAHHRPSYPQPVPTLQSKPESTGHRHSLGMFSHPSTNVSHMRSQPSYSGNLTNA
ncbi:transcriptional repressor [Coemansia sp. RSA 2522]|nr:hypothetical protein GGH98_000770 [Coemansia sp. RSA 454]KAJ2423544.1 hypothetical protein GGF47_003204 [Coemansia sp. RSA 2524]KAJ2431264.1 transcriptional repressor [Coemansia sp. RSA 2522]KAJ2727784.1 hypothetical protein H4S00_001363 [Coemansia sp. D1744]